MSKRSWAAVAISAAALAGSRSVVARAAVPVEQIESFEYDAGDNVNNPTRYAPVDFNGSNGTVTIQPGQLGNVFSNVTFHAVLPNSTTTATFSNHAYSVGEDFYGSSSPAYGSVSDVYADGATGFLTNEVLSQRQATATGPVPTGFDGGALVVNNSWVGTNYAIYTPTADVDVRRRIDFMVAQADVTYVAAAVTTLAGNSRYFDQVWSGFNSLAVSGVQTFDPTNPLNASGKQHADLTVPGADASFATAGTAGYAAALVAAAQAAGQADAARGVVVRSLLMAGADKAYDGTSVYTRQTANNLDVARGAGVPDYATSLNLLAAGEKPLVPYAAGGVTGTPATTAAGWAEGTVAAGGQSVLLLSAANAITGVTASLNWDVTQNQPTATTLDTTDAGVVFPSLALELRPVSVVGGSYVLGPSLNDPTLSSGVVGDNVQYLYSTGTLPAGTYALVVTGDPTLTPNVGLSYLLRASAVSNWTNPTGGTWGNPGNWANGVPDGQAAVASFGAGPGLQAAGTVTLDGNRTVGQLIFANANGYTLSAGTGGTLTIDDTGDSSGVAAPTVTVTSGSHTITAPVALAAGVTVNTAGGTALTLAGNVTGTGGLAKNGLGTLTLAGADNYGPTNVSAGSLVLSPAATLAGNLTVTGGAVTFAANPGPTLLTRSVGNLTVSGGRVAVAQSTPISILIVTSLTFNGPGARPSGTVDVGNGDLIVHNGSLAALTAAAGAGYAGGTFTGPGLTSSAAAADPSRLTAVGVVGNANTSTAVARSIFDQQAVVATDVLVKYTYVGDANLDGVIDGSDYALIDAGFASRGSLTGWGNGDFNYDGRVDASDYTLIDNAFNFQGTSLAASTLFFLRANQAVDLPDGGSVPEPTAAVAPSFLAAVALYRRRRVCDGKPPNAA